MKTSTTSKPPEKLILVAVQLPHVSDEETLGSLDELTELAKTMGKEVTQSVIQKREKIDRSFYLGKGKMAEVKEIAEKVGATMVVADDELSGAQCRNMEEGLGITVSDRTSLILEIFSTHASTREGKLQVEIASMNYRLVRLTGGYTALSRQRGGIGAKGPGEMQIESDRRTMRDRIQRLDEELDKVVQDRDNQRKKRTDRFVPLFALVGYTNAGKSTLLNALSGSRIRVFDGLFTTLDPTSRRVDLPSGRWAVLSDTVGFIHKIPHSLIKAFRATLECVVNSQNMILVCDISSPRARDQIVAVEDVLREMKLVDRDKIIVFNKIDRHVPYNRETLAEAFPGCIFISALTGEGFPELKQCMDEIIARNYESVNLKIPAGSEILKEVLAIGHIKFQEWGNDEVNMKVELPKRFLSIVKNFITE